MNEEGEKRKRLPDDSVWIVFFETTMVCIVAHFTNTCSQLLLGIPKNEFAWPLFAYLLLLKYLILEQFLGKLAAGWWHLPSLGLTALQL